MKHKSICAGWYVLICVLTVVFVACSHPLPLGTQRVNPDDIHKFESAKSFRVINKQPSKDKMKVGSNYAGSYYTSLYELSDAAVALLTNELTIQGLVRSYYTDKSLNLSVSDVKLEGSESNWSCAVSLDVETDEGYIASYEADNLTSIFQHVCGGAITLVITELLKDKNIIRYLEK